MGSFGCRRGGGGGGTAPAFWVRYYGGSALRAAARWWRGAERAGGRRRGVGVFESSAGVRPCVSRWSVSARHDRACSMAVESPKCWQRGVVRLVERLPGQGARAGCAQDGHTRPRTRVAVALARSGPPASTASEASRGPFLVRGERGERGSRVRCVRYERASHILLGMMISPLRMLALDSDVCPTQSHCTRSSA